MDKYKKLALDVAKILDDKKARDIVLLKVLNQIPITDYFIIATASNKKQVEALMDEVRKKGKELGLNLRGVESDADGAWTLVDYGVVVVHLFQEPWREYFHLEHLWGDCPKIIYNREIGKKYEEAGEQELSEEDDPLEEKPAPKKTKAKAKEKTRAKAKAKETAKTKAISNAVSKAVKSGLSREKGGKTKSGTKATTRGKTKTTRSGGKTTTAKRTKTGEGKKKTTK